MKFRYLLIAALAGLALVGCNKEEGGENNGSEQIDNARYMGFTISMPSAVTKAAGTTGLNTYQVGEDYENAIKTLHFFFYRNGAYVSWGYGDVASAFNTETAGAAGSDVEETRPAPYGTGNIYSGVVVLESTMAIPNQVLCVANSRNPNWYRNKTLEQVKSVLHTGDATALTPYTTTTFKDFQFMDGGSPYFVMFTSPMYGSNASGVKEVKYVTDIYVEETSSGSGVFTANSYIKNTREEAQAKPVDIYIERMAARLEIANLSDIVDANGFVKAANLDASMKDASSDPVYDIKPLSWSVIAANKKAYSLKKIDLSWWSQTGPNQAFNGNWLESGSTMTNPLKTSEQMYTRINWTKDPNYDEYALANRNYYPHSAREYTTDSELKYWSATEIQAHYDAAEASEGDIIQRYCYENTFPATFQSSPRITGTMLLLYAQAKKHGAADYENLYAYMGQIYNAQEYCEHLLSTIAGHGHGFYYLDGSDYKPIRTEPTFTNPASGYFKAVKATTFDEAYGSRQYARISDQTATMSVNDPSEKLMDLYKDWVFDLSGELQARFYDTGFPTLTPVTDEKGYADGYVTLIPTAACPQLYVMDTNTTTNPGYDPAVANSEYRTATDRDLALGFLGSVVEPANKYTKGRMYYAIPIEHFGKATTSGSEPEPLEGNYGVVRNNFYKVSIGTIKSLGHGIDDVTEPIVPGDRKKPYYIAAKINILSWQLATQTADLEE